MAYLYRYNSRLSLRVREYVSPSYYKTAKITVLCMEFYTNFIKFKKQVWQNLMATQTEQFGVV
jgi:hypothetical protein